MATQRPTKPSGRSRSDRQHAPKAPADAEAPREVVLADNRKARFNYAIDRTLEAGIARTACSHPGAHEVLASAFEIS